MPGEEVAGSSSPAEDDYFVLKPKHSAFFETTLDTLLAYLGAKTLILTGIAGNICILFSANDAYMRDYNLIVPSDCVVSNTRRRERLRARPDRARAQGDSDALRPARPGGARRARAPSAVSDRGRSDSLQPASLAGTCARRPPQQPCWQGV